MDDLDLTSYINPNPGRYHLTLREITVEELVAEVTCPECGAEKPPSRSLCWDCLDREDQATQADYADWQEQRQSASRGMA